MRPLASLTALIDDRPSECFRVRRGHIITKGSLSWWVVIVYHDIRDENWLLIERYLRSAMEMND